MRFMMLYKPGTEAQGPPSPEHMAGIGRLIDDMTRSGVLLATDGLQPSSKGARLRISGDKFTVTDGPFLETKELIAGYAIIAASSKEDAIQHGKGFLTVMGEGECEIRQMHDMAPAAAPDATGRKG
jgi:hypothetical protein